jgi:cell division protein FtsL
MNEQERKKRLHGKPLLKRRSPEGNIVYLKRGDTVHKVNALTPRFSLSPPLVFTIILIFLGALGSAAAAAHMANTRREINRVQQALNTQLDANATLASQMPQPYTTSEIERIASERLGMARPDPSQIIYIHVPPISHVVLSPDAYIPAPAPSIWVELRVFFTAVFNRVFGG